MPAPAPQQPQGLHDAVRRATDDANEAYAQIEERLANGAAVNAYDASGATALHEAAGAGHEFLVDLLIGAGAQVNAPHRSTRDTALHLAARNGRVDVVRSLTAAPGVQVDALNGEGDTPLHEAVLAAALGGEEKAAAEETARLLIERGADSNVQTSEGLTVMHLIAANGLDEVVRVALRNGGQASIRDGNRDTPVHLAAASGHMAIVLMLLEAEPDLASDRNAAGQTPLDCAQANGQVEVATHLSR